jgi:hypothetical protein
MTAIAPAIANIVESFTHRKAFKATWLLMLQEVTIKTSNDEMNRQGNNGLKDEEEVALRAAWGVGN